MNLYVSRSVPFENHITKHLFKLKPESKDGLVLNIHQTKKNHKIRLIHACFNSTGQILACANNEGHIYVIDFVDNKFWRLKKFDSCAIIKFSLLNINELLIGLSSGAIHVIDSSTGFSSGELLGHSQPVNSISYSSNNLLCLTSTKFDAIVWELKTNSKIQVLNLDKDCRVKFVVFMPNTNNILACFQDDMVQIWTYSTFESLKLFSPDNWNNYCVRNIAFTRNGTAMVVVGYVPTLAIFLLNKWKLSKYVKLPDHVLSVKYADFIPQSFDGGCNKILAILSGQGTINFYDIQANIIISELNCNYEIHKFYSSSAGNYLACVLSSGEINIFNISQYVIPPVCTRVQVVQRNSAKLRRCHSKISLLKSQINDILETDKLKAMLKEFGEYPEAHRLKIWEKLLQLPNNKQQYNSVINHVTVVAFKCLNVKYPLENKNIVKTLRNTLNNLVTWSSFFVHVDYLPVFVFPFAKVFQNKPIMSFEALCTIIINWCQHWFEYFPLPPVNILAMAENVLLEHDPELLHHFYTNNLTPNIYAWILLESAFSEVLTAHEWLVFWDHVLSNEPAFLVCSVVAYNILHRATLLSLEDFQVFYHNQNPIDVKSLIGKTYSIQGNTSEKIHPRQYLQGFTKIASGQYPQFFGYPRNLVEFQSKEMGALDKELRELGDNEQDILETRTKDLQKIKDLEIDNEQNARLIEMEKACLEKILAEKEKVKQKREKLENLRRALLVEEKEILSITQKKVEIFKTRRSEIKTNTLLRARELTDASEKNIDRMQNELLRRHSKLLEHKTKVEQLMGDDEVPTDEILVLRKQQQDLEDELEKLRKSSNPDEKLLTMNIATGLAVINLLIKQVKNELYNEPSTIKLSLGDDSANMRVIRLQRETRQLEKEVSKLLKLLSENRKVDSPTRSVAKDMLLNTFREPEDAEDG